MVREDAVHLTVEGHQRLVEELAHLRDEKRPELVARIREENEAGDVSDNSEYEELKEELVMTDARIRDLEFLLKTAVIVEPAPKGEIGLGSSVTLKSDDGETETWRLVSPEEADTRVGAISTDSPVGHSLTGLKKGERAVVETPGGSITYTIVRID
jgi:transcription elongation factor GreA